MKYYKVLSQYDNKARYRSNDNGQKIPDNTVLITKEVTL
jgi:hypothetical protein